MVGPELPDLIAGLASLISLIAFVQFWKPKYRPEYEAVMVPTKREMSDEESVSHKSSSVNEQDDSLGKNQTEGAEKNNATRVEAKDGESHVSEGSKEKNITPIGIAIVKPNAREIMLAWSPWVLIVCVVIM